MSKIAASDRDAFYEARRSELARVALRLWAERGFDRVSVAAIATEAGVSKGTFYLYFESKDALLEDVLRRHSLAPNVHALIADLQGGSLDDAVRAFVRTAWRQLSENRELVLLVLRELPSHLDQARQFVERVMVPANALLADHLRGRLDPARAEEISFVIAGRGLIGLILSVFLTQEVLGAGRLLPVSEDEITESIAELFLHGVEGKSRPEVSPC